MKALLRSSPVQAVAAFLIWTFMALIGRSVRWQIEGEEAARAAFAASGRGLIVAAWHSRILFLPALWTRRIRRWPATGTRPAMLISLSRDGEFVARALKWLGVDPIRGSAANKKKKDKDKGGLAALREASARLAAGGMVGITPDGPRGPRQRAGLGPILLAQRTGAPILIFAAASRPCQRLSSWDRFMLPFPFARGVMVFAGTLSVERGADAEAARAELEARLNAATHHAESRLGLEPTEPGALGQPAAAAQDMAAE